MWINISKTNSKAVYLHSIFPNRISFAHIRDHNWISPPTLVLHKRLVVHPCPSLKTLSVYPLRLQTISPILYEILFGMPSVPYQNSERMNLESIRQTGQSQLTNIFKVIKIVPHSERLSSRQFLVKLTTTLVTCTPVYKLYHFSHYFGCMLVRNIRISVRTCHSSPRSGKRMPFRGL